MPAGWSVSPARADTGPIPAGASVDVDFTVTPPAGTPAAGYEIAASVSAGRVSYRTAPHRVLVGYDNTAPGTPATQKSTGYGGDAGRAIDGNTDGHFGHGSVTHTVEPEKQAWWQTDLGTSTDIGAVTLWNRTDCCSGRLKDYYVLVSDEPFTSDSLEETLATPGVRAYHQSAEAGRPTHIPIAETGRYVRIQLKSASDALSLAEVAVYTPVP